MSRIIRGNLKSIIDLQILRNYYELPYRRKTTAEKLTRFFETNTGRWSAIILISLWMVSGFITAYTKNGLSFLIFFAILVLIAFYFLTFIIFSLNDMITPPILISKHRNDFLEKVYFGRKKYRKYLRSHFRKIYQNRTSNISEDVRRNVFRVANSDREIIAAMRSIQLRIATLGWIILSLLGLYSLQQRTDIFGILPSAIKVINGAELGNGKLNIPDVQILITLGISEMMILWGTAFSKELYILEMAAKEVADEHTP